MTINDGGSDKDTLLNTFTGNTLPYPTSSTGNQMFVSYTNNDNINTRKHNISNTVSDPMAARSQYASNQNTAFDKGFSASFVFGKKLANS